MGCYKHIASNNYLIRSGLLQANDASEQIYYLKKFKPRKVKTDMALICGIFICNLFSLIKSWIVFPFTFDTFSKNINEKIDKLEKEHKEVREALISRGIIKPFTLSSSLKQITERGYNLLYITMI